MAGTYDTITVTTTWPSDVDVEATAKIRIWTPGPHGRHIIRKVIPGYGVERKRGGSGPRSYMGEFVIIAATAVECQAERLKWLNLAGCRSTIDITPGTGSWRSEDELTEMATDAEGLRIGPILSSKNEYHCYISVLFWQETPLGATCT